MLSQKLYSIATNKCPKCHTGKVFEVDNPYNLSRFDKMNNKCQHCGEIFDKEPGYFYGAMYVSYGLMAGWFMLTFAIEEFLYNTTIPHYILFVVITSIVFMPLTFRTSRLIWLNMFIHFDESKAKTKKL